MITSDGRSIPQEGSARSPGGRRDLLADGASSAPGRPSSPSPRVRKLRRARRVVGTLQVEKEREEEEQLSIKFHYLLEMVIYTE